MARKAFQRLSDNGFDTLDVTESAVNDQNSIFAFKANGMHYHLKKHRHPANVFASARAAAGAAATGGGIGARVGMQGGPKRMLRGAAAGSFVGLVGELAFEKVTQHLKEAKHGETIIWCYVDEEGNEVYKGPVSA